MVVSTISTSLSNCKVCCVDDCRWPAYKPCHSAKTCANVFLPKAPVLLVTPDPDTHPWQSEHVQSMFRAFSQHFQSIQ
jgi:hypothetical protein